MIRRLTRSLLAVVVLVALIVVVPILLVRFGPGLPHSFPSASQLGDIAGQALTDSAVFAVLTIAAWLAWAAFTVSVLVELTAELRGVARPRLPIPSPFQSASRNLVAALLMTVTVAGPFVSPHMQVAPALATPATSVVTVVSTTAPPSTSLPSSTPDASPPAAPVATPAPAALPSITVSPGDSPWALAERHLGSGQRWRELWDLNKGLPQPNGRTWVTEDLIGIGWTLRLPADATNVPTPVAADATPASLASTTYVVQPGDTLSQIAADHLGNAGRSQDLFDANTTVVQPDGRQLNDPNVILPGWTLKVPTSTPAPPLITSVPGAPTPPTVPTRNAAADPAPEVAPRHVVPAPKSEEAPTRSIPSPGPTSTPATPDSADPPTTTQSASPATTAGTEPSTSMARSPRHEGSSKGASKPTPTTPSLRNNELRADETSASILPATAPQLAGITGAIVLATGLGLLLRRKRRRRDVLGTKRDRHLTRHSVQADATVEAAIISAGDLPLVRWAGQELARLVAGLSPKHVTGVPVAVELSEEAGIELLWDSPQPDAPGTWTAADGGWAWRLPYDADAEVPDGDLAAPIPTLVTIGQRDGRQLLLNLEAVGSLAVTGDDDSVEAFIRFITVELGSDEELADAYVTLAGIDVAVAEHLDRVASRGVSDVEAPVGATGRSIADALESSEAATTFAYRMGRRGGHLDASVVIADPIYSQVRDNLLATAIPHRGPTVVFASDVDAAQARLHIDTDGTAHLEPLGLNFQAAGIPASTAAQVQELFAPNRLGELPGSPAVEQVDAQVINLAALTDFSPQLRPPTNGHSTNGHTSNGHTKPAESEQTGKAESFHRAVPSIDIGAEDTATSNGEAQVLDLNVDHIDPDSVDEAPEADVEVDAEVEADVEADSGIDTETEVDSDGGQAQADDGLVEPEMLVRVLGVPGIPDRPDLKRRQLVMAVYLASRGGWCTVSGMQDAVWNGKAVQVKTLWNLVSKTRSALGVLASGDPVMPQADRPSNTLRVADGVETDLGVFRARFDLALTSPPAVAIALLTAALDLIEGPPFDAAGYDWAHHTHQLVAEASDLIERATELLVALAMEQCDVETARHGLVQGLRGLPGNEVLYRLRMSLEHDTGNLAAVKGAYVELLGFLGDLEADPSDATVELYEEFTRTAKVYGRNV